MTYAAQITRDEDGWMDCSCVLGTFFHPIHGVQSGTIVRVTANGTALRVVEVDRDNYRIRTEAA